MEFNASESNACPDPESEPNKGNGKGKQIIDADPSATVATAKIQKDEPENPEENTEICLQPKIEVNQLGRW